MAKVIATGEGVYKTYLYEYDPTIFHGSAVAALGGTNMATGWRLL